MAKIFVTGSKGQLGSELKRLCEFDRENSYIFADIEELDITDKQAVADMLRATMPNFVVNCAAYTAVDLAESDVERCRLINATAVKNLAEGAKQVSARLIHVSTDYVYSGEGVTPYLESDVTAPQSVYGTTKLEGEGFVQGILPHDGVIIRTAWLYSPYGKNFVNTIIKLGEERDTLSVVDDQRGTPTNAANLASAIIKIINSANFVAGIYNYTDAGECTWYDFTKEIHKQCGITNCVVNPITTQMYPTPAKRPKYSVLSKDKIVSTYGIELVDWRESLSNCLDRVKLGL